MARRSKEDLIQYYGLLGRMREAFGLRLPRTGILRWANRRSRHLRMRSPKRIICRALPQTQLPQTLEKVIVDASKLSFVVAPPEVSNLSFSAAPMGRWLPSGEAQPPWESR